MPLPPTWYPYPWIICIQQTYSKLERLQQINDKFPPKARVVKTKWLNVLAARNNHKFIAHRDHTIFIEIA